MLVAFLPWVYLGIGIIFLVRCYRTYLHANATLSWPSTQGTVVTSEIKETGSSGQFTYKPVIIYAYQVHGKSLQSSKLQLGDEFLTDGSHSQAEKLISEFPVGQSVVVFYNSEDPRDSVLVEGIATKFLWLGVFVSLLFFVFAALAFAIPGFPFN